MAAGTSLGARERTWTSDGERCDLRRAAGGSVGRRRRRRRRRVCWLATQLLGAAALLSVTTDLCCAAAGRWRRRHRAAAAAAAAAAPSLRTGSCRGQRRDADQHAAAAAPLRRCRPAPWPWATRCGVHSPLPRAAWLAPLLSACRGHASAGSVTGRAAAATCNLPVRNCLQSNRLCVIRVETVCARCAIRECFL